MIWGFVSYEQVGQNKEHQIARYFTLASSLQPYLYQSIPISDSELKLFSVKVFKQQNISKHKVLFQKGDHQKGFEIFEDNSSNIIIYIYNPISSIYLQDIQNNRNILYMHFGFILILLIQLALFIKIKNAINPLSQISYKLSQLQEGNLSKIDINSNFIEMKNIVSSYNNAIKKIEYILNTREMFNKVFMHEIKMPLAKALFLLKQIPNEKTNTKLTTLVHKINQELDDFRMLESLIAYNTTVDSHEVETLSLIQRAADKIEINFDDHVRVVGCDHHTIYGDEELWILCFKNLIENALKYSNDGKLTIQCESNGDLIFENRGNPLPVDISKDQADWKFDMFQKHKSSTGYGFGLFIIKNIANINSYSTTYSYQNGIVTVKLSRYC
jgi:two-component system OmpR family sensor kinase